MKLFNKERIIIYSFNISFFCSVVLWKHIIMQTGIPFLPHAAACTDTWHAKWAIITVKQMSVLKEIAMPWQLPMTSKERG